MNFGRPIYKQIKFALPTGVDAFVDSGLKFVTDLGADLTPLQRKSLIIERQWTIGHPLTEVKLKRTSQVYQKFEDH